MSAAKPKLAMGAKKVVGTKMECPTCGFKWSRPPGEENKPCPKCFKPLPKGMAGSASPAAPKTRPKAASTSTPSPPKPKPAAAASPAAEAPAAASAAPAASLPKGSGLGTSAKVGLKMECPTCGFKWTRPPGEENKPCPKCFKPLPKSAIIKKVSLSPNKGAGSGGGGKKPSIFDKLTDPKQYTGAHKQRFDADGKGRGIAGRTG